MRNYLGEKLSGEKMSVRNCWVRFCPGEKLSGEKMSEIRIKGAGGGLGYFWVIFGCYAEIKELQPGIQTLFTEFKNLFPLSSYVFSKFHKYKGLYGEF